MINCERCNKPINSPPSSGKKYCSRECRIGQVTLICKCGKSFITRARKKSPKTCGSPKCKQARELSREAKEAIANKGLKDAQRINGIYHRICKCGKAFTTVSVNSKSCSTCRVHVPKPTIEQCRRGAYNSLTSRQKSATEDHFGSLLPNGFKANDRELLSGLEIDYLYEDLAIEYHGSWHYNDFHDHYKSTVERDRRKTELLAELNYKHYVVGWAASKSPTQEFFEQHAYYISELFEDISPFKFLYDRRAFVKEYSQLVKTKGKTGYICNELVNWYHSYRWYQKTSTHNLNAVECWANNRDKIIKNRLKYSSLKPTDLRRYFLLFDYVPSAFSDILAKNLALKITGSQIADPFAGYGNRMLGVTAAGKIYHGFDINWLTVNANLLIISDLELQATCKRADSSHMDAFECDGLITCPPYNTKDDYGYSSDNEYYDMIRDTFKNFRIRDKGFVVIKPSLVDIDKFQCALGKIKSYFDIDWGGLRRSSIHRVFVI